MQSTSSASSDARLAQARALFQDNEPARAEVLLRSLQAADPVREDVGMLLAIVQRSQGHFSAAAETLFGLCRANQFEAGVSQRSVEFIRECERHTVAERICAAALARGAVSPELLMQAGNVARELGDFETARARYLAALDAGIDLDRHHVLNALANTRRYVDPADPEIARFARHFAHGRLPPRPRASAGFALAKAQDDLADYAAAARTLRQANAILHTVWQWDASAWQRFVVARSREHVALGKTAASRAFVPVFIVGMPRTGTTLTATLLARASGGRDRGEMRTLRFIADRLVAGGHFGSSAAISEAADLYRRLSVQDDTATTWYLDQDPMNFRYLHIVAAMFPQARVIHLRRDRADTALSLWCQDFAHPDLGFACDFGDIHACMTGHDSLMRHWKQTLALPIYELDYEMLVSEPDATLASLCAFIGAQPLAQPATDVAPVHSASIWQARQPVYRTSVGRWRAYAPFVPELARFAASA
jgi:tetratricopeptide (TPR) repeat protein